MDVLPIDIQTTWQTWAVLIGIGVVVVLYASERFSIELVSLAALTGLLLFFSFFPVLDAEGTNLLTPADLLAGFANPALLAIIALLVVGQGLLHSGAFDTTTARLIEAGKDRPQLILFVAFIVVLLVSAVMNNTPVTVLFIPIIAAVAAKTNLSPSKVMIPISFMSILGGTTTLIGTSTNLLVAETAQQLGTIEIGFFDLTPLGLFFAAIGGVYVLFIMPRLLPDRRSLAGSVTGSVGGSGEKFVAQLYVTRDHPLVGEVIEGTSLPGTSGMTVRMIQRGEHPLLPPYSKTAVRSGDVIIITATRDEFSELLKSHPEFFKGFIGESGLSPVQSGPQAGRQPSDLMLTEAIVPPGSRMAGYTTRQISFRHRTNTILLGIQRRNRMIRSHMDDIRMEAGDVLLLFGSRADKKALRSNRDLVLFEAEGLDVPNIEHAFRARMIFGVMVILAASAIVPIVVAAVLAATAMIASGCLNVRQAGRAIDRRIFVLVGTALALGASLQATGGAELLAHSLVTALAGQPPWMLLSAFFLLVAVTTNLLSNNATAVLFTPIAVSIAATVGISPAPFVFAVIFGANCSFATPMGYQTNLLVMGPGQYNFSDYLRSGTPLVIILWLAFTLVAPLYFGL